MVYSKYREFLVKFAKLGKIDWILLSTRIKVKKYKKNEIIHYMGDIADKLYFVNSGLLRAYVLDENGKDFTWHIFFNDKDSGVTNYYAVDYDSFLKQIPSRMSIEVLEDCELFCLDHSDVKFLLDNTKVGNKIGRLLAEEAYSVIHNHLISYVILSAEERFYKFMDSTPYWFDKIPQYHIASHLGITPQSLSRLKSKIK
ncbi:MAG: Crp/Fnr family transcriptional regulator [Arcobacteraceae bacterium]|nr:Crp/Fnr family transcriptional regulator [Arcobacteraceae bacterium]